MQLVILRFLVATTLTTLSAGASAQSLPDSTLKKIDSLFSQWNKPNSPGCAVGIVRNDSLIFSKGYGMANLEYGIPNSDETVFHMASVSKQFTAFSILLLARQNKLRLDDDIRKYLTWFPDLKQKITIRNLLNHTSGIRDQWQLLAIQGTRIDDVITQEHIVKLLSKQQALNFTPGDKNSYSNSNFTLLAEIVKSISGRSLRQFTDSAIFRPLGMTKTHFHDDYTELEKNRAYSYSRIDSASYANSILSYSNAGATSLFTTIKDMSKWLANFYTHKVGDQKDIDTLTQKTHLHNGKELSYALGIVSDTYRGARRFSHGGADAGFRTFVAAFPDLKMGFAVFGNVNDFNAGYLSDQVAGLFIKDTSQHASAVTETKKDTMSAVLKDDSLQVKQFLGGYIHESGIVLSLEIKDHKLFYRADGSDQLLIKDSASTYAMFDEPAVKFRLKIEGHDTVLTVNAPDQVYRFVKYQNPALSDKTLKGYTGVYYSPELDCRYSIELKDHHLVLTNNKYSDTPLTLAGPDHLLSDFWWMSHLMVTRNATHQITGFEINGDRITHVKFDKINTQPISRKPFKSPGR